MRNFLTYFFIILFGCSSCQNKKIDSSDILGQWKFTDQVIEQSKDEFGLASIDFGLANNNITGFNFLSENELEYNQGFYKIDSARRVIYIGNKTTYEITGDNLKYYDKTCDKWMSFKILELTSNTLKLGLGNKDYEIYTKVNYKTNPDETYDRIILSSSGCYGTCPIMSLSISRDGDLYYYGYDYTTKDGLFKSKISSEIYNDFEEKFKRADLQNMQNEYYANWTDDEAISVSFIKDNKIVKSIWDYGNQSPPEFNWAYNELRYLYQSVELDTLNSNIIPEAFIDLDLKTKNYELDIFESEAFFLFQELLVKGKLVDDKNFKPKYRGTYYFDEKWNDLYTDGQFFKITEGDKIFIFDLGYNFLTRNHLDKRKLEIDD